MINNTNNYKFILNFYKGKSFALSIEGMEHKVRMVKINFQVKRVINIPIRGKENTFLDITSNFDIDLDILYKFFKLYLNKTELIKSFNVILDNYHENLPEGEYLGSIIINDLNVYTKFREFMEDIAKIKDDRINL